MKVLIFEPGKPPRIDDIENDLDTLQAIVGGYIEAVYPYDDRIAIICNEEGKLQGLTPNRRLEDYDILVGTFIICGLGDEDFESLPEDMIAKYAEKFKEAL